MPVCVFKGTASHSRVSACAHIAAVGSLAAVEMLCWKSGCVLSHTQGREHASLEATQRLIQLRRGERILSAGWEPLKELSISVILSDCASGRSPW